MTTALPDLLAAVPALNEPGEPFTYAVEGDTVVGTWDIVKATTLFPAGLDLEHVDKDYRIVVSFDTDKLQYDYTEHRTSTTGTGGVDGGRLGARGEKSFFRGKSTSKEFSFTFGGITKDEDGVTAEPLVYSFETSRIKKPLFGFLDQHGWTRKKGFLSGLFDQ